MFLHKHTVQMKETDATGCLYFVNQIQIAMEAFEKFLQTRNFSIASMLKEKKFILPVVHTEADFFSPLQIGDELEVKLDLIFGKKSFKFFIKLC